MTWCHATFLMVSKMKIVHLTKAESGLISASKELVKSAKNIWQQGAVPVIQLLLVAALVFLIVKIVSNTRNGEGATSHIVGAVGILFAMIAVAKSGGWF